jgi:hypothetical protein
VTSGKSLSTRVSAMGTDNGKTRCTPKWSLHACLCAHAALSLRCVLSLLAADSLVVCYL